MTPDATTHDRPAAAGAADVRGMQPPLDAGPAADARQSVRDRTEFLWRCHEVQHAAIRFCDTKAGAALVLATAATGSAFQTAGPALPNLSGWAWWGIVAALTATAVGFVGSALAAMAAVRPRGTRNERSGGFIFFGDVGLRDADRYAHEVASASAETLADDLARDTWRAAAICRRKFFWVDHTVRAAVVCVLGATALQVLLVVIGPAVRRG